MNEDHKFIEALSAKLPGTAANKFKLLFRASQHQFLASKFHELCDDHGPTLVIIQSNYGHVFGGYTSKKWSSNEGSSEDEDAFLFVLRSSDPSQETPTLFDQCAQKEYAILNLKWRGPSFGWNDICIYDRCDKTDNWSSNITYRFSGNTLCG